MNVILIGYRGAGKSTVGKRLAELLGRKFVDTDRLIEEIHGAPVREIVESHGWEYFRAAERRVTQVISRMDRVVIAFGGGAVLDPENVRAMKENGRVIWLTAEPRVLAERMGGDPKTLASRPSLTGKEALKEVEEVLAFRSPYYEGAADVKIETSGLDVEDVAEKILPLLDGRKEE